MKYVALAALAATFWLLVATARLLVEGQRHDCRCPRERIVSVRVVPRVAPASVAYVPPPGLGNPIRKAAIVSGMNAVKPQIARCYAAYGVPGMALVNAVIAPSGLVSSANVTGRFADTPTGACVEQAVLTARFPPSDGIATPYPFQLR
jgi:hypothetical protein